MKPVKKRYLTVLKIVLFFGTVILCCPLQNNCHIENKCIFDFKFSLKRLCTTSLAVHS